MQASRFGPDLYASSTRVLDQATSERDRVFPHINAVRQQQLGVNLPALLKVDMEVSALP